MVTQLNPAGDFQSSGFPSAFRNIIINGEMAIDQFNGGASVSVTGATKQSVDMIVADSVGGPGVYSIQRLSATPPPGFTNYLRTTVTTPDASIAASDYYRWYYWVEGLTMRSLLFGTSSAKPITVSFWARSSLTGTFGFGFIQNGSGRSVTGQYIITAANIWQYFSVPLPGDTGGTWTLTNNSAMALFWSLGIGTTYRLAPGGTSWTAGQFMSVPGETSLISTNGATLDITGLQLEAGTGATPFEYRPFPLEVQLCQRYYEKSYALDTAVGTATTTYQYYITGVVRSTNDVMTANIPFKVSKRGNPSNVILWSATGTSGQWIWTNNTATKTSRVTTADTWTPDVFNIRQQITSADLFAEGHWAADARL